MIKNLKLKGFRNFKTKALEFSDKITTIVGPNASGKTNILESLFLLSTAKSFKAKLEAEIIKYDEDIASILGVTDGTSLEVKITRGDNGWPKKRVLVNGVAKRTIDFAGNFKTVLFAPQDMDLVTESPSIRRKFLDNVLCQIDREYRRNILSYEKGLRQRNKLLFRIREEGVPRSQLLFWNQLLIKNGDYISIRRQEFIDFVNSQEPPSNTNYRLEYDRSVISDGRLEQYKQEEVSAATTLVGPHRDDFIFFDGKRNLASYGSRGEQRMGVLWLKMAELNFIEEKTSERPTLLLDDIFSELDHEHRDIVVELAKRQQTVITTADEHFLKGLKSGGIINL
ncbi:MAG TPA: DNA replication and repair protein RecF [Patescibacteria group bacterium]|nr:DNA replication and repair protein RecF [Patescibacteria group bacterium]